jgi:lipopolysaccharide biosynthesis glycosyltransferase
MLRMIFDLETRLPERLLYLDADTVVEKDPSTLFRIDLEACDRAMVPDAVFSKIFDPHYCNSGVILLILKKVRRDGLLKEGRHLLNAHKFTMPDQEAFNRCQKEKILFCRGFITSNANFVRHDYPPLLPADSPFR